jgi:hypothetical protein
MTKTTIDLPPKGGFSFDLCRRNAFLESQGTKMPKFRKTGTTIVGLIFKDGVILGADTRATEGEIVCDKNCEKIHYLAPNISCCGAGTAADTENVTGTHLPLYSIHLPSGGNAIRLFQVLHSFSIPFFFTSSSFIFLLHFHSSSLIFFQLPSPFHSSSFSSQVCLRFEIPSLFCSELLVK